MTDKRRDANRRNALRSTGPKTAEGVRACKNNALRHGLRALQAVVPGEDPDEWEAHRAAVVADLDPHGAVELALAEQVAAKLWRLGRVARHEADLVAIAQDEDEVLRAHELAYTRMGCSRKARRTDIPTREDVADARRGIEKAQEKLEEREAALRTLEGLAGMKDGDLIEDWSIYEPLKADLGLTEGETDNLFQDEDEPFVARHVRVMLEKRGTAEEVAKSIVAHWRDEKIPELRNKVAKAVKASEAILRRYESALERRRRANGLPGQEDLDRIQRYEAHLERGLHKALDRLRDLREARGAAPPRSPSVALAVVQTGQDALQEGRVGPFGSLTLEAQEPEKSAGEGGDGADKR